MIADGGDDDGGNGGDDCPDEFEGIPACCDGVDFKDKCAADEAGAENCQKNSCAEGCICTLQFDPVCCDGVEFSNSCFAECAFADLDTC